MELLINEMIKRGASRTTMEAKVFGGGAVISGMTSINVGERNTQFVLDYLKTERIAGGQSKDVLDIYPRKVCFLPASGQGHGQAPGSGQPRSPRGAGARGGPEGAARQLRRRIESTCSETTSSRGSEQDTRGGGRRLGPGAQPAQGDHQPAAGHGLRGHCGRPLRGARDDPQPRIPT
jgi:hypothetical protein